jgi:alpha-tubulin suppressor-like RCC1 family protein
MRILNVVSEAPAKLREALFSITTRANIKTGSNSTKQAWLWRLLLLMAANTWGATHIVYWGDDLYFKTNMPPAATNIVSVTGGDRHLVALRADGCVFAWGNPSSGLGPLTVPADVTNAAAIAAGSAHSLALLTDGTVSFWGNIASSGVTNLPAALGGQVLALAEGSSAQSILALRADNKLVDCGNAGYGLSSIPTSATNVVGMAVGSYYAAILRGDGKVVTWGQCYPGIPPTPPSGLSSVVAISGGINHILALKSNGTLVEWGILYQSIPAAATNIVAIACGGQHSLALRADGTLLAWGLNGYGQLNIPPGLSNIVSIAATTWGSLVLTADDGPPLMGRTLMNPVPAGLNARLQETVISTTPVTYQWYSNGVALVGATNSTLILINVQFAQAGTYSLVASNSFGTATNSDLALAVVPAGVTVQPQSQTALVGGSVSFNVSVIGQGPFAYQWKLNGHELPAATTSALTLPNLQMSDAGLYSVAITNAFGGIISSNATLTVVPLVITAVPQDQYSFPGGTAAMSIGVRCNMPVAYQWQFQSIPLTGATASTLMLNNLQNTQAGLYTVTVSTSLTNLNYSASLNITPIASLGRDLGGMGLIPWALNDVAVVANGAANALALKNDGTVVAWGGGVGEVPSGLTNAIAVAAGNYFNLVLNADDTLVGWGRLTPPPGLSNVVAVGCGFFHSLALKADGTVIAWGDNTYGQTNVPPGLSNVVAIAAGQWHSLALSANGHVTAWGAGTINTGTDPDYGQSIVPSGLANVVAIAAGADFSLALRDDGSVVGWGQNYLGDTTPPMDLSNVVAIAAGSVNGLALRRDGTVAAWGDNSNGETNIPVGLANVVAISGSDMPYGTTLLGQGPPALNATILSPTSTTNGFAFSFPSQKGHVYLVESSNSLRDANWTPLPLIAGTGRILTVTDPTPTGAQRFYRVRRW